MIESNYLLWMFGAFDILGQTGYCGVVARFACIAQAPECMIYFTLMSDEQPQGYVYQFKAIVKKIANLADGGYSITLHTRGTANEAIGELLKRVMMPGEYDVVMVSPEPEQDNGKHSKVYT